MSFERKKPDLFPLTNRQWKKTVKLLDLTQRQSDVVKSMLHGMCDKQIAAAISMQKSTVRGHISKLLLRFGLDDRLELSLFVIKTALRGGHK